MARRDGLADQVVRGLSGHSTRIRAAQDMIAAGIEVLAILQAGRRKSASMVNATVGTCWPSVPPPPSFPAYKTNQCLSC